MYFIYARKSTRSDDRQMLSIPAQLKALGRLASDQNLKVIDRIIERESAHTPGRPKFNAMLRRIERGDASGIIAWHPDRLARNSKDGGEVIYLLDTGKLRDLKFSTFWFESTPQGKSNLGHEFVQTKQYSDKLSHDTIRGQREKASMGYFPGKAPRGYLNNIASKTIVLDPELAPIIRKAFERYASGNLTIHQMREYFAKHDIVTSPNKRWRSKGGNLVHSEFIRRFLRNPFYYGHFEYGGEHYEGKHTPIISKKLFDEVQNVLKKKSHPMAPVKQAKAFTKLFCCGTCAMSVTAEIQKGHIYYRCSRKSPTVSCFEPYIREELLNDEISRLLSRYAMPHTWVDSMLKQLDEEARQESQVAHALIQGNQATQFVIAAKLQKLLESYLEGVVDREIFLSQKQKLLIEKKRLQEQITICEQDQHAWVEPFKNWILTVKTTGKIAKTGTLTEKKALAQTIFGSNLTLVGKKAFGEAVKPWSFLHETSNQSRHARCYRTARPFFAQQL